MLHVLLIVTIRRGFYELDYLFVVFFFFFNDTATTEIYTLSLHDALPISATLTRARPRARPCSPARRCSTRCNRARIRARRWRRDRKSTRLNSSHGYISYAVFCLKKKKKKMKVHKNYMQHMRVTPH